MWEQYDRLLPAREGTVLVQDQQEGAVLNRLANVWARLLGRPLIPPGTTVGRGVYIGRSVNLDWHHGHLITISDFATVVDGTRILCHDASSNGREHLTWVAPVTIGKRAFVGADCVILPGVTIHADAVVGAGSVVSRDVEAGTIVVGVPARVVGRVADLDARRRDLARDRPVFSEREWHRADLSPDKISQLRAAGAGGGYFLRGGESERGDALDPRP